MSLFSDVAGKQSDVILISEERSGSPGTEDLNQTLVRAARRLASVQQACTSGGPPVPSAKPALQTKKHREPLGNNIHLATALILPAPSTATVSEQSSLKLRCQAGIVVKPLQPSKMCHSAMTGTAFPKSRPVVPVYASCRNSWTLPWLFVY